MYEVWASAARPACRLERGLRRDLEQHHPECLDVRPVAAGPLWKAFWESVDKAFDQLVAQAVDKAVVAHKATAWAIAVVPRERVDQQQWPTEPERVATDPLCWEWVRGDAPGGPTM